MCHTGLQKSVRILSNFLLLTDFWHISDVSHETFHEKVSLQKCRKSVRSKNLTQFWSFSDETFSWQILQNCVSTQLLTYFWHIFEKIKKTLYSNIFTKSINILSVSAFWQIFDTTLIKERKHKCVRNMFYDRNMTHFWLCIWSYWKPEMCQKSVLWQNYDTFLTQLLELL